MPNAPGPIRIVQGPHTSGSILMIQVPHIYVTGAPYLLQNSWVYTYCTDAHMVENILYNETLGVHLIQGYALARCTIN